MRSALLILFAVIACLPLLSSGKTTKMDKLQFEEGRIDRFRFDHPSGWKIKQVAPCRWGSKSYGVPICEISIHNRGHWFKAIRSGKRGWGALEIDVFATHSRGMDTTPDRNEALVRNAADFGNEMDCAVRRQACAPFYTQRAPEHTKTCSSGCTKFKCPRTPPGGHCANFVTEIPVAGTTGRLYDSEVWSHTGEDKRYDERILVFDRPGLVVKLTLFAHPEDIERMMPVFERFAKSFSIAE